MSSGFGARGGVGRCYDFWLSFESCAKTSSPASLCFPQRDDYLECLHHKKEYARIKEIKKMKEAKAAGGDSGHH
ncbi:hypothetical protein TrLO_g8302 [Triparma laevis f. longispina]|uniref:NADH dehydrogenase [ubiquinone] iron-sulfur protein 5 n=1 Tax=Triparma laevis f. longispina TaxID=1714387 RepID=A0A9W7AAV1_9STRA|nr:hypothetical protein TrLO_g8302 [Triparma laevis f. longispina]